MTHVYIVSLLTALICITSGVAQAATVSVDWSAPSTGHTTFRNFASNDSLSSHLSLDALDPKYAADMKQIGFHFLRLHDANVEEWTTDGAWDPTKVATELNAPYVKACGDSNIILTINTVPKWCRNADNSIDDAEYAAFCAKLVKMVNVDMGRHIKYWECLNEPSTWKEFSHNNWAPMFALYNACSKAMKAVDPTIKMAGNVPAWYQEPLTKEYLAACWPNIDVLSSHWYFTGDTIAPPLDGPTIYNKVMTKIPVFDKNASSMRADIADLRAHRRNDGHPILLDLEEFNMGYNYMAWGWGQDEYVGAAFFAACLTHTAHDHYDICANWSSKDDYFGMIDIKDKLRPAAYVYEFANHYLVGSIARSSSDDSNIECLAIQRGPNASGAKHAVMLTNRYYETKTVTLRLGASMLGRTAQITTIDNTGMRTVKQRINSASTTFIMPGFSVKMIALS
jgi:xylan 1,4-beta-xylosidase